MKSRAPVLCQIHVFLFQSFGQILMLYIKVSVIQFQVCQETFLRLSIGECDTKCSQHCCLHDFRYRTLGKYVLNKYFNMTGPVSLGLRSERQGEIGNSASRQDEVNDLRRAPADIIAQIHQNHSNPQGLQETKCLTENINSVSFFESFYYEHTFNHSTKPIPVTQQGVILF